MIKKTSSEAERIKEIIDAIDECWQLKNYEGIGSYLTDDVVIAPPRSEKRKHGRAAYIQSYRDYDQAAETLQYIPGESRIDVMGNTAVAVCPFEVVYILQGAKHHERGENILVFVHPQTGWKIAWRTVKVEETKGKSD